MSLRTVSIFSLLLTQVLCQLNPEEVCDGSEAKLGAPATIGLNQAFANNANPQSCVCSRTGRRDTLADCSYIDPLCLDPETCWEGGTAFTLDVDGERISVKSCANPTPSDSARNACVTVVPSVPGNFSQIASCQATMNGEECSSCKVCEDGVSLTISCCNVVDDALISECIAVDPSGAFVPILDPLPETPGQCSSALRLTFLASLAAVGNLVWILSETVQQ